MHVQEIEQLVVSVCQSPTKSGVKTGTYSTSTPPSQILMIHMLFLHSRIRVQELASVLLITSTKRLLPNQYLTHFYLVRGIWILSSDKVTIESFSHASILLNKFYLKFHELYGNT